MKLLVFVLRYHLNVPDSCAKMGDLEMESSLWSSREEAR